MSDNEGPDEVPESWQTQPDELEAADHAEQESETQRRMGEEYGSVPLTDPNKWPDPPAEWPVSAPEDRSKDQSRVHQPREMNYLDLLNTVATGTGFSEQMKQVQNLDDQINVNEELTPDSYEYLKDLLLSQASEKHADIRKAARDKAAQEEAEDTRELAPVVNLDEYRKKRNG